MSRYTRPARTLYKADTRRLCVQSVLSWPYPDLAGDVVDLDGIDFTPHQSHCEIDLEHARTHLKAYPVAWARESLSKPGAPYAVERVRMDLAGEGEPEEWHTVPIGTSYFDPADRISHQTFALVEQGLLPAVSGEFRMVPNCYKALGPSPLEPRSAYRFTKSLWDKWTLCARPVNGGAMHLDDDTIAKSLTVPDGLAKMLVDRRVSVGGLWEPLHGRLLKALADVVTPSFNRTTVRVEKAAMEPDDDDFGALGGDGFPDEGGTDADLTPDMDADMGDGGAPANGVTAMLAHADEVMEALERFKSSLESSDNPQLIKDAMKWVADSESSLEKLVSTANKHDAKIQAAKGNGPAPDEGDDEQADDDEEPTEGDDADGDEDEGDDDESPLKKALAKVRPVYTQAIRVLKAQPRRLKASEVKKAKEQSASRAAEVAARLAKKVS